MSDDAGALASPPAAQGIRLLPGGRSLSADAQPAAAGGGPALRKRLFRPAASPGAVLHDGRLRGLWRV
jgi:hypothetical protein